MTVDQGLVNYCLLAVLLIEFQWNTVMPICLHVAVFYATVPELSGCSRDYKVCKAYNIYYMASYRTSLLGPCCRLQWSSGFENYHFYHCLTYLKYDQDGIVAGQSSGCYLDLEFLSLTKLMCRYYSFFRIERVCLKLYLATYY